MRFSDKDSGDEDRYVVLARVQGKWMASASFEIEIADSMAEVLRSQGIVTFACLEQEFRAYGLPCSWYPSCYFPGSRVDWIAKSGFYEPQGMREGGL